jgi:hypothetical protein
MAGRRYRRKCAARIGMAAIRLSRWTGDNGAHTGMTVLLDALLEIPDR